MAAKTTSAARRRDQRRAATSLTQLTVLDAVRAWVVPAVTAPAALIVYVLYNVEVLEREAAVGTLGVLALVTLLWIGVRGFISEQTSGRLAAIVGGYAVLWGVGTALPFFAIVNPGSPLLSAPLHVNTSVALPIENRAGQYRLVVEGNFAPSSGQSTRRAHYRLATNGGGSGEQILEGDFSERFLQQRLGRRGSATVRDLHTATQHVISTDGQPLTVKLDTLSPPDTITAVTVHLYAERFPQLLFIAVGIVLVAGAVLVDAWHPGGQNQGLLTAVTLGTLCSITALRWWGGPHPGFGQLAVEGLLGGIVGSVVASVVSWIGRPLLRRLPAAP